MFGSKGVNGAVHTHGTATLQLGKFATEYTLTALAAELAPLVSAVIAEEVKRHISIALEPIIETLASGRSLGADVGDGRPLIFICDPTVTAPQLATEAPRFAHPPHPPSAHGSAMPAQPAPSLDALLTRPLERSVPADELSAALSASRRSSLPAAAAPRLAPAVAAAALREAAPAPRPPSPPDRPLPRPAASYDVNSTLAALDADEAILAVEMAKCKVCAPRRANRRLPCARARARRLAHSALPAIARALAELRTHVPRRPARAARGRVRPRQRHVPPLRQRLHWRTRVAPAWDDLERTPTRRSSCCPPSPRPRAVRAARLVAVGALAEQARPRLALAEQSRLALRRPRGQGARGPPHVAHGRHAHGTSRAVCAVLVRPRSRSHSPVARTVARPAHCARASLTASPTSGTCQSAKGIGTGRPSAARRAQQPSARPIFGPQTGPRHGRARPPPPQARVPRPATHPARATPRRGRAPRRTTAQNRLDARCVARAHCRQRRARPLSAPRRPR